MKPAALQIPARDGYLLGGTLYGGADRSRVVLMNGAMAVPSRFYRYFAEGLAEAGYSVVCWDYRGVGLSRPRSLKGFPAEVTDWASLDLPGAIDWACSELLGTASGSRVPAGRLLLVGHSLGGQIAGLVDNPGAVDGMVTMSAQSGYWRLQGGEQKWAVLAHGYLTLPLMTRLFGYSPWKRLGLGEDLPRGVALEWAGWLRDPKYLLGDDSLPLERYAEFEAPVLAYSIDDDKWGTARSVDAMMQAYPNVERRHLVPVEHGLRSIGHVGFFRPESSALWKGVVEWLDEI